MPYKDPVKAKAYAKEYRELHKEKHASYQKIYRAENDSTEYKKAWYKRKRFEKYKDMTKERYLSMIETQRNQCAICQVSFSEKLTPYIDHCHKTGEVRGLLCFHCNTGIGHLKDNPVNVYRALCYLEKESPID